MGHRTPLPLSAVLAATVLAGTVLVAAACTGGAGDPPTTPPSGSDTSSSAPESPDAARHEVPLVLAVHHSRGPHNVSLRAVRRVLANGAQRWSQVGSSGGAVDVVTGGTARAVRADSVERVGSARSALDRVRTDRDTLAIVPATAVDETVRVLTVGGVHPLRSPNHYRPRIEATRPPGRVVELTVVGDIMLGRRVGKALEAAGDPAAVLRPLARRLSGADITVGNLESTLSRAGSPTQGNDSFAARPQVRKGLRLAGFDVLSLANNHLGDFGDHATRRTFQRLRAVDLPYVGAGPDRRSARSPVVIERHGTRIGFLATDSIGETPRATKRSPGTNRLDMPPRTGPLDRRALRRVSRDIADLAERVDTVVVLPHWGTQYTNVPEKTQRTAARRFAQAGADLVVGGHPHWVQGWEQVDGTTIVHSLGNFVFDMDFMRETQEGVFLEIVLWDGEVRAVEPVPYVIGEDFAPRLSGPGRSEKILRLFRETSRGPFAP